MEYQRNIKEKELVVVGCPYLDVLKEKVVSLTKENGKKEKFTVLIAPSWGKNGILSRYGTSLLDPLVETGFPIIVRPHPQSKQSEKDVLDVLEERYRNRVNVVWDYESENLQSLSRADILISDFSGVIFDYTFLFDRPFFYVNNAFDARPYDSFDLEEPPWKFRILPEIGVELKEQDFGHIGELLLSASKNIHLQENRKRARETAWQFPGDSGNRIAEFLEKTIQMCNTTKHGGRP
ncbi:hypothetical protein SDC9_80692 [bioreactor metagenome]|uniref:CDP-glycerol:poly(Glycerophosphate) glycerophosphotransferase n=1 Tax=bioreactor metagenome TaxID=1076179 RepID=A0A644YZS7_9ZZZZ